MFQFEHIEYLYLIAIIPLLLLLYYFFRLWLKRDSDRLSEAKLFKRLAPNFSLARQNLKFGLLLLSILLLCIAWANPQWGSRKEKVKAFILLEALIYKCH